MLRFSWVGRVGLSCDCLLDALQMLLLLLLQLQCAQCLAKIWWCQWMCWLHRAQCRGSPLRPFPKVLLCPQNTPKLRLCMGLFFGSMGVACWVWAGNRSASFAACPATRCFKTPNFWADPPPWLNNGFQYTVPISHSKLYGSLGEEKYGKESSDSISKASMHVCGLDVYLY